MFDFQKLTVYNKAKSLNLKVTKLLNVVKIDRVTNDQLRRAENIKVISNGSVSDFDMV